MADIVANAMRASMAKAQANGRTIPGDTLEKLAKTLVFEVLQVAEIMGLVKKEQMASMARPVLQAAMQAFAQPQQQRHAAAASAAGAQQQMARGAQ